MNVKSNKNLKTQEELINEAFMIVGGGENKVALQAFNTFVFALNNVILKGASYHRLASPRKSLQSQDESVQSSENIERSIA